MLFPGLPVPDGFAMLLKSREITRGLSHAQEGEAARLIAIHHGGMLFTLGCLGANESGDEPGFSRYSG